jgi:hypothetical protein
MPRVELEPTTPAFEWAMTFRASSRAAAMKPLRLTNKPPVVHSRNDSYNKKMSGLLRSRRSVCSSPTEFGYRIVFAFIM